jgi:hypothetical protein
MNKKKDTKWTEQFFKINNTLWNNQLLFKSPSSIQKKVNILSQFFFLTKKQLSKYLGDAYATSDMNEWVLHIPKNGPNFFQLIWPS